MAQQLSNSAIGALALPDDVNAMPTRMSLQQFLDWEHLGIAEWVDGEVTIMAVKYDHQSIVDFLNALLRAFVEVFNLGRLISAPYSMKISEDGPVREPDLMFVAANNTARITNNVLAGPADLIIEVVSEESMARDYDVKFEEYQAAGVREYWIIDSRPNRQRAGFYVLDARGKYKPVPTDDDGLYHSTVLTGLRFDPSWLWQDPLPEIQPLLMKIGGDVYKKYLLDLMAQ